MNNKRELQTVNHKRMTKKRGNLGTFKRCTTVATRNLYKKLFSKKAVKDEERFIEDKNMSLVKFLEKDYFKGTMVRIDNFDNSNFSTRYILMKRQYRKVKSRSGNMERTSLRNIYSDLDGKESSEVSVVKTNKRSSIKVILKEVMSLLGVISLCLAMCIDDVNFNKVEAESEDTRSIIEKSVSVEADSDNTYIEIEQVENIDELLAEPVVNESNEDTSNTVNTDEEEKTVEGSVISTPQDEIMNTENKQSEATDEENQEIQYIPQVNVDGIRDIERLYGDKVDMAIVSHPVDRELLLAMIMVESTGDGSKISSSNAIGLMQVIPDWHVNDFTEDMKSHGIHVDSVADSLKDDYMNIDYGAYYMHKLLEMFNGDYVKAVQAYNAGQGSIMSLQSTYGDDWINHLDEVVGDPVYYLKVKGYYNELGGDKF